MQEREETSQTNNLKQARSDDIHCNIEELSLARDMGSYLIMMRDKEERHGWVA